MISALGTASLFGTAVAAAVAGLMWTMTAARGGGEGPGLARRRRAARAAVAVTWCSAAAAVVLMEWALLAPDFSVAYVAETGSRELPIYYTITALWAGPGGSLLFWVFVLATVVAVFARRAPRLAGATFPVAMAVTSVLVGGFALVTALGLAPFEPVASVPGDGPGPNPLLRDHPAMGIHPPILYAGFASLVVPFGLAFGALLAGRVDARWARTVRAWTLAAAALLTVGIALGAWWSYAVLGWGGYWAWDPVENVSLLPWLVSIALLHVVGPTRRGRGWAPTAVALSGAAFLLVLLGTLLTRSGVVVSVHAFSESAAGPALLGVFGLAVLGLTALLVARQDRLGGAEDDRPQAVLSRQSLLNAQTILIVLIVVVVLTGTVLPALLQITGGERISVGAPWFNRTAGPPALALLVLMALGPLLGSKGDDPGRLARRLRLPGVAGLATVGAVGLAGPGGMMLPVAAGIAVFVFATVVCDAARRRVSMTWRRLGGLVAHAGIAAAALAVVGTGYGSQVEGQVAVGEAVTTGQSSATLLGVGQHAEGAQTVATAEFLLGSGAEPVGTVRSELIFFPRHDVVITSPAVHAGPARDLQVALLDVDPEAGTATVRLTVTPLLTWLWVAAGVTAAGLAVAGLPGVVGPVRGRSERGSAETDQAQDGRPERVAS